MYIKQTTLLNNHNKCVENWSAGNSIESRLTPHSVKSEGNTKKVESRNVSSRLKCNVEEWFMRQKSNWNFNSDLFEFTSMQMMDKVYGDFIGMLRDMWMENGMIIAYTNFANFHK